MQAQGLPEPCGNSRLAVYTGVIILMYLSHLLNMGRFCTGFFVTLLPVDQADRFLNEIFFLESQQQRKISSTDFQPMILALPYKNSWRERFLLLPVFANDSYC